MVDHVVFLATLALDVAEGELRAWTPVWEGEQRERLALGREALTGNVMAAIAIEEETRRGSAAMEGERDEIGVRRDEAMVSAAMVAASYVPTGRGRVIVDLGSEATDLRAEIRAGEVAARLMEVLELASESPIQSVSILRKYLARAAARLA